MIGMNIGLSVYAGAATAGSLTGKITSDIPADSQLTLKNTSDIVCQIADTATGTIAITRVVQNGQEVTPSPIEVSLDEDPGFTLLSQLKTLQAGESVSIPLRTTTSGDKVAVQSVVWSQDGGTMGLLYMVDPKQPLQIELNYMVPIDSKTDVPMCAGTHASTIDAGGGKNMLYIVIGALIVIVSVGLVVWWLLKNRKKKPVVAAIAVFGGLVVMGVANQPVYARVTVPDSVRASWDSCVASMRANSDITGPILALIDDPAVTIIIDPVSRGGAEMLAWPDGTFHIEWNINDHHAYYGTGGNADPCSSIYHELYHIMDMRNGTFSRDYCAGSRLEIKETMATRAQNLFRLRLGLPERSHYGDIPVPTGDCRAPAAAPPPPCRGSGCARTTGEPHLTTFDGHRYDFQAAGEFVLARVKDTLEVQVRQQQWEDSQWVAINTAAVIKTPNHTIQVAPEGSTLALMVDGKKQAFAPAKLSGGELLSTPDDMYRLDIALQDGTVVTLTKLGLYAMDITIDPSDTLKGKFEGLLGDYDGDTKNDLRLQGTNTTVQSDFESIYPKFADSWRVSDASSLFTYDLGKNTASYTNRSFPYEKADAKKLAGYAAAKELCIRMGVTDVETLNDCAMDVAVTGRPEFARSAVRNQITARGADDDSTAYALQAKNPNDTAKVTFTAKKNEKLFVDIYSSTFPSNCGALTIRDSADATLGSGCIINGTGYIDTVTIPADGEYSLQLRADDTAVGEARARLYRIVNQTGTAKVDGDAVNVAIPKPGMQAALTFDATAGQRLFVSTSDVSLPSQCAPLSITAPDGQVVGSGCIVNNSGVIDTVVAAQTGTYTLRVDLSDRTTGRLKLRVGSSQLITKNIGIGDSVAINFAKPGDDAEVRFTGTAGERVYIDVFDSTLPSQCGGFSLHMPSGDAADGCVIGKQGTLRGEGVVLPSNGTYIVTINPADANMGKASIRVRR